MSIAPFTVLISTDEGDQAVLAWSIRRRPDVKAMVRVTATSDAPDAGTIAFDTAIDLWADDFASTLTRGCTVTITEWSVLSGNAARAGAAARQQLIELVTDRLLSPENVAPG